MYNFCYPGRSNLFSLFIFKRLPIVIVIISIINIIKSILLFFYYSLITSSSKHEGKESTNRNTCSGTQSNQVPTKVPSLLMCAGKIMYSTTHCRENESEKQEKRKRKMNQEDKDTLNDEERITNNIKDNDRSTNNNDSSSSKTD